MRRTVRRPRVNIEGDGVSRRATHGFGRSDRRRNSQRRDRICGIGQ